MTVCGTAAVFFRLMLTLLIIGNAVAAEDVCKEKSMEQLAKFLAKDEVKKIKGKIETKVLMGQLVQSNLVCTTQISNQSVKIDKMTETLGLLQARNIADSTKAENSERNNKEQNQAILSQLQQITRKLEKMEQIEKTLESVKTQVQENTIAVKLFPGCQKFLQRTEVNRTNLLSAFGKHFYINKTQATWFKARDWCTARGMRLASLETLSDVEAIDKELKNRGLTWDGFWVSASDIGRAPGKFHWLNGTPVDSIWWDKAHGQPDNFGAGEETCAWLHTRHGKLWDWPCSYTLYIMCDVPSALLSCL